MNRPPGEDTEDAERWWQAYELAGNDQAGQLRERAAAGDGHARRQLASWLSDRGRTEEAIEVIRPLADAGDDMAQLWLARWLADRDQLDELRWRSASGGYHALIELAGWLADHECLDALAVFSTASTLSPSGSWRRVASCSRSGAVHRRCCPVLPRTAAHRHAAAVPGHERGYRPACCRAASRPAAPLTLAALGVSVCRSILSHLTV